MLDLTKLNPGEIVLIGCAFCVLLTLHFTIQLLSQHLFYWKNPKEQKAIIIIILMAPIYAAVSFVGLLDFRGSKVFFMSLESIKECYEALVNLFLICLPFCRMICQRNGFETKLPTNFMQVIAKFMALMYSFLNISISKNIVPDEIKGREIHHSFPMTLFQVSLLVSSWTEYTGSSLYHKLHMRRQ